MTTAPPGPGGPTDYPTPPPTPKHAAPLAPPTPPLWPSSMMTQNPAMWIIPHTHWDREWYEPHDVFRARLVMMVDALLDVLEVEPDYCFTLDGQSAAALDYLEIRPENRERLAAAVTRGQLAIGPFLILMDEFGCDGETTIRNLELGIRSARTLGQDMRVGYLPDMFGHAAQTPQILRGFGVDDACLWRGAPAFVDRDAFMWRALDGSSVRVEYLWDGYGSALKLFEPVDKLALQLRAYLTEHADRLAGHVPAGMYGADHTPARPDLLDIVRTHNAAHPDLRIEVATLDRVIATRAHSPGALATLPTVTGELRSHAMGNILPGVFSVRTGIKGAMSAAERDLTIAERLDVWAGGPSRTALTERGWRLVVESSAHDSVTGCGSDSTAEEVEARLRTASNTARGVIDTALGDLAAPAPAGTLSAFNPSAWAAPAFGDVVIERPVDELPDNVQLLHAMPDVIGDEYLETRHLRRILRRIHGQELFGKQIRSWAFTGARELTFLVAPQAEGAFDLFEFTAALDARIAAESDPARLWHVLTLVPPSSRVLIYEEAPALGNAVLDPFAARAPKNGVLVLRGAGVSGSVGPQAHAPATPNLGIPIIPVPRAQTMPTVSPISGPIAALVPQPGAGRGAGPDLPPPPAATLANGRIRVDIARNGLATITDAVSGRTITGALALSDEGDRGDAYNFGPTNAPPITKPTSVDIDILESGPLRGRVRITRIFDLPIALDPQEPSKRDSLMTPQIVDTVVELRATEAFVRVTVSLVNQAANHRLRLLVPTGAAKLDGSASAGQFGVTERGRMAEGGWGEFPLPTFPASRWVWAGGTAVHTDRLMEYEIVSESTPEDHPDVIAVTLLRAVGLMSVNIHPLRDEPAGSEIRVPGAQYLGRRVETSLAIDLSAPQWSGSKLPQHNDQFRLEPILTPGGPQGTTNSQSADQGGGGSEGIIVDTVTYSDVAEKSVGHTQGKVALESLRRLADGAVEARFVNYHRTAEPLHARLSGGPWDRTDMTGRVVEAIIDPWDLVVPPGAILTLRSAFRG